MVDPSVITTIDITKLVKLLIHNSKVIQEKPEEALKQVKKIILQINFTNKKKICMVKIKKKIENRSRRGSKKTASFYKKKQKIKLIKSGEKKSESSRDAE